jgi:hypothetical protein
MKVSVECYAGYRAEETPRSFHIADRLIQVAAVMDRWTTEDYRYFKVEGNDGQVYLLRQPIGAGEWELI